MIGVNARDLSSFAIDRHVAARARRARTAGPDRRRGERDPHARAGRRRRARRRGRDPRRHGADARSRSGGEARRAALAPAREGVRADAPGGRRRRRRGGRRSARLHPRGQEPAPRDVGARRAGDVAVGRRVRRRAGGHRRGPRPALPRRRRHRPRPRRRAPARRRAGRAAARPAVGGLPTRSTGTPRRAPTDGSCSPAGSARRTSAPRSRRCIRGRSTPSSSLETEPGIKDHARVRAYVEAARA